MEIPEKLKLEYLLALDNHIETVGKENKEGTLKKIFEITREIIEIKSVKSKIIDDSVGYIRLTAFNENSSKQIRNKIKKI